MDHPKPYVITIVGPESSGKTTLARELAAHLHCPWVPEYAREYLESLGRPYHQGDIEAIAEGQFALLKRQLAVSSIQSSYSSQQLAVSSFQSALSSQLSSGVPILTFELEEFGEMHRTILIVDSGLLSLRMWARIKYGITVPVVEGFLANDETSMYVLCRPVYPWEKDPLREAPSLLERAWIYNLFLKEIKTIQSL